MIGLRPGLQAFRARVPQLGPTVYQAATVGELPAADTVPAQTIGLVGSAELTAIYRSDGTAWVAERVLVSSSGSLPTTAAEGALALVGSSTPLNTRIGWVRQSGAWTELPAPPRSLSSLTDVLSTDATGDWASYVDPTTGALSVYRLTAAIALPGGGSRRWWVPPIVYAGTPAIVAMIDGDETMPGYGSTLRGYTYLRSGAAASIASTGGYMRFDAPAPASGGQFAYAESPTITGAQRFYSRGRIRGSASGIGQAGMFVSSAVAQTQYSLAVDRTVASNLRVLEWNVSVWADALNNEAYQAGGRNLDATTPLLWEALSGNLISDMIVTRLNGETYCANRRNMDGATDATTHRLIPFAAGNVSSASAGRFETADHVHMTY